LADNCRIIAEQQASDWVISTVRQWWTPSSDVAAEARDHPSRRC